MRFLLDTNFLIRAATAPERLPDRVAEVLANEPTVHASVVSLWDICLKRASKTPGFKDDPQDFANSIATNGFIWGELRAEHPIAVAQLPPIHSDPFDRVLIAQTATDGLVFLTTDTTIARHPGPIEHVA